MGSVGHDPCDPANLGGIPPAADLRRGDAALLSIRRSGPLGGPDIGEADSLQAGRPQRCGLLSKLQDVNACTLLKKTAVRGRRTTVRSGSQ